MTTVRLGWLRLFWAGLLIVGAIVGYLVSTGLGERLLHREIETQLGRLLRSPARVAEVEFHLEQGLRFEAKQFEAFWDEPDAAPATGTRAGDAAAPPALRARRLVAFINPAALLIGRLELSELVLEAPRIRLERLADGGYRGLEALGPAWPMATDEAPGAGATAAEQLVRHVEQLDGEAAALFADFVVADRIEVIDGTIQWIDATADADDPAELRVELINTVIESNWFSDTVSLEWKAVFVDGEHAPFPFEARIDQVGETQFDWAFDFSRIPLAAAEAPLSFTEGIEDLSGDLTAQLRISTADDGVREVEMDGTIEDGRLGLHRSRASLERGKIEVKALLRLGPDQVELRRARIADEKLALELAGTAARPLRAKSMTHLESRMVGFELADVFTLVESLERDSDSARGLTRLIERVEGGHILSVAAAGDTSWREWTRLIAGETNQLPEGLRFSGAFEQVRVATGPGDRIEDLRGQFEWANDRLILRDASAAFRGVTLPQLHFSLNGTSALAGVSPDALRIETNPPSIPGLSALIDILEPDDPDSLPPVKAIGLAIDHLEHPLFRWPLHDLRLLIEPLRRGVEVSIQDGTWGGVGISGDMVLFADPQGAALSVELELGRGQKPSSPISPKRKSPANPAEARWAKGRFELEFRPRPRLPFQKASGFFRLDGTRLVGNEVNFAVEPTGQLATRMVLDLAREGRVDTEISFALTDGRFEHISEFIALPPTLIRGEAGATGTLRGPIRPDKPLIREFDGSVRVEAKHGRIRTEIPLLLRLSRASEGYNPFANEDELKYERMNATIAFRQGVLSSEDFEIEGPLRFFVRGEIDPFSGPASVRGVVGLFLFRAPNQFLGNFPVVRYFLPGSERGLVGAYFRVGGALGEPDVETLPMASLMSGVPEAFKAPFKALQYLFDLEGNRN